MEGDVERLEAHLRSLKRHGANVLVLDNPSEASVCTQLLGSESVVRRRLLVRTHGAETVDRDADPRRFGLVDVPSGETRTALTDSSTREETPVSDGTHPVEPRTPHSPASGSSTGEPDWYSRPPADASLPTLARHVHDHLTRFEAADPSPGEIRVCFDSLDAVFDDEPYTRLSRFLTVVTARIRAAHAIGHFHLSTSADSLVGTELEPLFDATVETRPSADGARQRWTLHGPDIRTDWLRLD